MCTNKITKLAIYRQNFAAMKRGEYHPSPLSEDDIITSNGYPDASCQIPATKDEQFRIAYRFGQFAAMETIDSDAFERTLSETQSWRLPKYLALRKQFPKIEPEALVGLEMFSPFPSPYTKLGPYLKFRALLQEDEPNIRARNILAFKAFLLFGTPEKLLTFMERFAPNHHLFSMAATIKNFAFPSTYRGNIDYDGIDFRLWGAAFLRWGRFPTNILFNRACHEIAPQKIGNSISLKEAEMGIQGHNTNISRSQYQTIVELSRKFRVAGYRTAKMIELFTRRAHDPDKPDLPDLTISGSEFGLPNTIFRRLPHDDPRQLFLGKYARCCEWAGSGHDATIKDALLFGKSAFYAVEETKTQNILAYSWWFRSEDGTLNNEGFVSSENSKFQRSNMFQLIEAIAKQIKERPLGFGWGSRNLEFDLEFEGILERLNLKTSPGLLRVLSQDRRIAIQVVMT